MVVQLHTLGKIDEDTAAAFRRRRPKELRETLAGTQRPANDRADMWLLREQDRGRQIHARAQDEIYVVLPEIPSSGYRWSVEGDEVIDRRDGALPVHGREDRPLALLADGFELAGGTGPQPRIGGGGSRRLLFRVLRPGRTQLRLANRRPWLPSAPPAAAWEVEIDASRQRMSRDDWGLSPGQKPLLALRAA